MDGATRMTESAAIIQYLATRDGPSALSVEPGDPAYGDWLNGLHFGEATLTFPRPWCSATRAWSPRTAVTPGRRRLRPLVQCPAEGAGTEARHQQRLVLRGAVHGGGYLGGLCPAAGGDARAGRAVQSGRGGLLDAAAGARGVREGKAAQSDAPAPSWQT
uniref:Uncharacterized protein n=1 Tax=Phenylobacterium glaciei TaxID=2803784 RepID=A0A974P4A5_9CAUL|nr:hypothetical protein JKL49_01795 [Phenylobacterium glaciei]